MGGEEVTTPAVIFKERHSGGVQPAYFGDHGLDPTRHESNLFDYLIGTYKSAILVDARGRFFYLKNPRLAGLRPPYKRAIVLSSVAWLLSSAFLRIPIWLRFTLNRIEQRSVEETRAFILDILKRYPDEFRVPTEIIEERVRKAKTPRGMIGGMFRP